MAKKENNGNEPVKLEFSDNRLLMELCGHHDSNLQQIEEGLGVQLVSRGNKLAIMGTPEQTEKAKIVLEDLYEMLESGMPVASPQVDAALRVSSGLINTKLRPSDLAKDNSVIKTPMVKILPRSVQQHVYVNALKNNNLIFGVGPAGTGKTYLATAVAVSMLAAKEVKKIILTRPVVEAGESLGFLPGTLEEKIDPYLRPLFDALNDMLGFEKTREYLDNQTIEIAPLAYMRGRTLKDCVMILDEAQNTTTTQMKMFLTRMGANGKMIVTGDISQIDLRKGETSGLKDAIKVLDGIDNIEVVRFNEADVVRHELVSRIVAAYDDRDRQLSLNLEEK